MLWHKVGNLDNRKKNLGFGVWSDIGKQTFLANQKQYM